MMRKKLGPSIRPNHMLPETPLEKKDEKSKLSEIINNSPEGQVHLKVCEGMPNIYNEK